MWTTILTTALKYFPTKYIYIVLSSIFIVACSYAYYNYSSVKDENETLNKSIIVLKDNEKRIIEAYEHSIQEIEKKARVEAENQESKNNAEKSTIRLNTLKERYKNEKVTDNSNYVDFVF